LLLPDNSCEVADGLALGVGALKSSVVTLKQGAEMVKSLVSTKVY
jgi:hypothetical protein